MGSGSTPRAVIVSRTSAYSGLLQRHGTLGQARFFLERRDQSLAELRQIHEEQERALALVEAAIPVEWRRARVLRGGLDRFLFEPEDLILTVGQDGLVANVAKYLQGQPVIGINPSPNRYPGVLVPHPPQRAGELMAAAARDRARLEPRVMVQARLDDGQELLALNEIFVGHASHQSARYRIRWGEQQERQSSSGLIVTTGTGATGWARSIHRERGSQIELPAPTEPTLAFFVREAWPSAATATALTEARMSERDRLFITSEMDQGGVAFGDGIEADHIELLWGQQLQIRLAETRLHLVVDGPDSSS